MKTSPDIEKIILIVLDGFGLAPRGPGNPITADKMPFLDKLVSSYKSYSLVAAGLVVGLEWGIYGNSEVGHGAMGTGRVVVQAAAEVRVACCGVATTKVVVPMAVTAAAV